jgi:ribonuclease HII
VGKILAGIDEAGRGSVFGPLVIVGLSLDSDILEILKKKGLKDSKLFNGSSGENLRSRLALEIQTQVDEILIKEISPIEIDKTLNNRPKDNLNLLEIRNFFDIIMNLESTSFYIDTLSTPRYTMNQFGKLFDSIDKNFSIKVHLSEQTSIKFSLIRNQKVFKSFVISTKADRLFPIVSAASCVAKHVRDQKLRKIEEEWKLPNLSLGKGYPNPNDLKLMNFLKEYKTRIQKKEFDFIRYTWNWEPLQNAMIHSEKKLDKYF